jgi:hypothetical protein
VTGIVTEAVHGFGAWLSDTVTVKVCAPGAPQTYWVEADVALA